MLVSRELTNEKLRTALNLEFLFHALLDELEKTTVALLQTLAQIALHGAGHARCRHTAFWTGVGWIEYI